MSFTRSSPSENASGNSPAASFLTAARRERHRARKLPTPTPTVETLFGAECAAPPFRAVADVVRPQKPGGFAAVLVREGTSIKEAYLREAAFLDYCFNSCGAVPARIFVYHVNKTYVRAGDIDPAELLVERDVTRRVRKIGVEVALGSSRRCRRSSKAIRS